MLHRISGSIADNRRQDDQQTGQLVAFDSTKDHTSNERQVGRRAVAFAHTDQEDHDRGHRRVSQDRERLQVDSRLCVESQLRADPMVLESVLSNGRSRARRHAQGHVLGVAQQISRGQRFLAREDHHISRRRLRGSTLGRGRTRMRTT